MMSAAIVIQGAAEYGAAAGGSSGVVGGGGPGLFDHLPMDLLSDPLVVAAGVLALLVVVGLFRTRGYRS
jgi:hypothetical protein